MTAQVPMLTQDEIDAKYTMRHRTAMTADPHIQHGECREAMAAMPTGQGVGE